MAVFGSFEAQVKQMRQKLFNGSRLLGKKGAFYCSA